MEQISHVARYLIFTVGVNLMSTFQWNCNSRGLPGPVFHPRNFNKTGPGDEAKTGYVTLQGLRATCMWLLCTCKQTLRKTRRSNNVYWTFS